MKTKLILGLIMMLSLIVSANYAQEFTLTTSAANTTSSKSTIDLPALNGNPNAIIFATPMGNTATLNPNPIGAWYYNNKWNIFNITHAAMPIGATFKVQYFVQPDANHFLHIITTGGSATVPRSYLDYPVLNNQPNAQFKIFQNHSAVYTRNPSEAKAEYEAGSGKWFIENVNGTALSRNTAYNIIIASSAIGLNPNTDTPVGEATPKNPTPISPNSTTPTGNAGGDLNGTYPNPKVIGLQGSPVSKTAPTVGQLLRYNGKEWEPLTINDAPMWNAGYLVGNRIEIASPSIGQVLKYGGGASGSDWAWYPANDETGISGDTARYNAGAGLSLNGTTFSAQNTAAMWNANQIVGGKISTTTPPTAAGQVLKWNGTEWAPAKDEVAATIPPATIQTFYNNTAEVSPLLGFNGFYDFVNHSYPIEVKTNSRLIISGSFKLISNACLVCSTPTLINIGLKVNNVYKASLADPEVASHSFNITSINNYMIDLSPGKYTVQFSAKTFWIDGNQPGYARALYTSIIVVPQ